jgi:hypothetical protein
MNKLETLRLVELECKALIGVIELHRQGVEDYEDVMIRLNVVRGIFEDILKEKEK